jgi:hypothetical protein
VQNRAPRFAPPLPFLIEWTQEQEELRNTEEGDTMPRFDTSFDFGANVKGKSGGKTPRAPKPRKKRKGGGTTSAKSRKYFGTMHGS